MKLTHRALFTPLPYLLGVLGVCPRAFSCPQGMVCLQGAEGCASTTGAGVGLLHLPFLARGDGTGTETYFLEGLAELAQLSPGGTRSLTVSILGSLRVFASYILTSASGITFQKSSQNLSQGLFWGNQLEILMYRDVG